MGDYDDDESSQDTPPTPKTNTLDHGPFAGLPFPYESARANSLHVVRECISTYLITHPHLDHLAGFVINTAAFHNTSRPKRLAALPSTVSAIKTHIFNDIIWPNLTDEDGGVGFVTFQRLTQGGNIAVGEGYGKGYIEVCDGLCVRAMKISHGHCTRGHLSDTHRNSEVGLSEARVSKNQTATGHHGGAESPKTLANARRTPSVSHQPSQPGTPGFTTSGTQPAPMSDPTSREVVVDSTAYFIRDDSHHSGRECLIFGDVEPDSISLNPRTAHVWAEAAPKIASGLLRAVFIECSYDDSQADAILFGHLAPRHVVKELSVLAQMVKQRKEEDKERRAMRKRKRNATWPATGDQFLDDASGPPTEDESNIHGSGGKRKSGLHRMQQPPHLPVTMADTAFIDHAFPSPFDTTSNVFFDSHQRLRHSVPQTPGTHTGTATPNAHPHHRRQTHHVTSTGASTPSEGPLAGLKVVIIHVKDTLTDGPLVGDRILQQLMEHESVLTQTDGVGLGCEFVISKVGESYWV